MSTQSAEHQQSAICPRSLLNTNSLQYVHAVCCMLHILHNTRQILRFLTHIFVFLMGTYCAVSAVHREHSSCHCAVCAVHRQHSSCHGTASGCSFLCNKYAVSGRRCILWIYFSLQRLRMMIFLLTHTRQIVPTCGQLAVVAQLALQLDCGVNVVWRYGKRSDRLWGSNSGGTQGFYTPV